MRCSYFTTIKSNNGSRNSVDTTRKFLFCSANYGWSWYQMIPRFLFLYIITIVKMKTLNLYIDEKLKITRNTNQHTLFPKTKEELQKMIEVEIEKNGNECSLNHIDVSKITSMKILFYKSEFNGDISNWDVSNVTNMEDMFSQSMFKGDISNWDTSSVTDMNGMFYGSEFNGDISKWDVSNVKDMNGMFQDSEFTGENGDISNWNVSNVTDINWMFFKSKFNSDISNWDVSNVTNMLNTFWHCPLQNNPPKWYKE